MCLKILLFVYEIKQQLKLTEKDIYHIIMMYLQASRFLMSLLIPFYHIKDFFMMAVKCRSSIGQSKVISPFVTRMLLLGMRETVRILYLPSMLISHCPSTISLNDLSATYKLLSSSKIIGEVMLRGNIVLSK